MRRRFLMAFFSASLVLLVSAGVHGQDSVFPAIAKECFDSILRDGFIDEQVAVLGQRSDSLAKRQLLRDFTLIKGEAAEATFVGLLRERFTPEEISEVRTLLDLRRLQFESGVSPNVKKKFCDLITDFSLALQNARMPADNAHHPASPDESTPSPTSKTVSHEPARSPEPVRSNFILEDITANSRDAELHSINAGIEIEYQGVDDEPFRKLQGEIRDLVIANLIKRTVQQAKEDVAKRYLHKELQISIERLLEKRYPGRIKVLQVLIPAFLIK